MSKRPVEDDSDIDVSSTDSETELEQQEEVGEEIVDVDFDFFDLNPEVDFHATKTFLRQLFGDDCAMIDISGVADVILQENSVGTTIKTDGKESDPFAFLSVINLNDNASKASIKTVIDYVLKKTSKDTEFNMILKKLLSLQQSTKNNATQKKIGWIFSERMINMPVEVVPPMYKMLLEEMSKAEDSHEKYEFDYFLIILKVYNLVAAKELADEDEDKKKSSSKRKKGGQQDVLVELDYFHYEDIILEANASYKGRYDYTEAKQETDSRRVFTEYGIDPKLSVLLLKKDALAKSVPEMEEKFPAF